MGRRTGIPELGQTLNHGHYMDPNLREALRQRVYPITRRIALGQFATRERLVYLRSLGVTHILNVGEAPSLAETVAQGFHQVADLPIVDLERLPDHTALACLDKLYEMLRPAGTKVFLHCAACQNRSPTILWLYLIACGLEEATAKNLIVQRCPDAIPGHPQLVDDRLLQLVKEHGGHYSPLQDPDILAPA